MGGGCFGNSEKIHPIWQRGDSLRVSEHVQTRIKKGLGEPSKSWDIAISCHIHWSVLTLYISLLLEYTIPTPAPSSQNNPG